jgi:hypothetical protein
LTALGKQPRENPYEYFRHEILTKPSAFYLEMHAGEKPSLRATDRHSLANAQRIESTT